MRKCLPIKFLGAKKSFRHCSPPFPRIAGFSNYVAAFPTLASSVEGGFLRLDMNWAGGRKIAQMCKTKKQVKAGDFEDCLLILACQVESHTSGDSSVRAQGLFGSES